MAARYGGPIVDAHHHFWRMDLGRHPWLRQIPADSADRALCKDFLPADYAGLAARHDIVASVHVEANWDPADPLGETAWLDGLERPEGIACRYVAHAALGDPASAALIERHAAHPRTVGLREIVSWHPDPARRRTPANDRFGNRVWRENLRRAGDLGLSFDLLITPHQFEDAARLAADFETIALIVNHYGSPMDRDADGMRLWREGLKLLARQPNIAIKLSDPVAYDHDWTWDSLADVTQSVLDAFGPGRCLFGTDHPVSTLHISFDEWVEGFRRMIGSLGPDEAAAVMAGNAARLYRIPLQPGERP